jgi:hypothetical protein
LLRATGLVAATDALVRVKSHYPEVDMAQGRCGHHEGPPSPGA